VDLNISKNILLAYCRGLAVALVLCLIPPSAQAADSDYFGSREIGEAGLIGIIYDLKQNQKREPSGVGPNDYFGVIREFLDKGWEESVLNRYFRSARPLYTTQIFIPLMGANAAPNAFDMQNVIKPSVWVVHYKGQVSPPADGTYRFICYADDMIAVAVNGKTVCEGSRDRGSRKKEYPKGSRAANGELALGDWVDLKKDETVDLDVIVGERPGGQFCAFLMYEKKGESYASKGGTTVYPIFQLAPHETPDYPADDAPPFLKGAPVWHGHQ